MATFAEIQAEVIENTARPDLVVLTKQSIRAAIVAAHSLQDWARDIKTHVFSSYVPPVQDTLAVQYYEEPLPSDFRQIARVIADFGSGNVWDDFKQESGSQLFLYSGSRQPFTWRIVGNTLRIGFTGAPVALTMEYYSFPAIVTNTDPATTDSWIVANALSEYVTILATQRVLRAIGMADDARMLDANLGEARADLLANYS